MSDNEYVDGVFRRADEGDMEAIYEKGALYDLGELVPLDKCRASKLFKEAADLGHAHSAWIHACELLWGLGSYSQNIKEGAEYLTKAIDAGSGEACITMARLYLFGELGYEKNKTESDKLRRLALKLDGTVYDALSDPDYIKRVQKHLSNDA